MGESGSWLYWGAIAALPIGLSTWAAVVPGPRDRRAAPRDPDRARFYLPIVACVVLSALLSAVVVLWKWLKSD